MSKADGVHVDRDPGVGGEVTGLGQQPVGDVDHRGGAGLGGDRARRRTAAPGAGRPRPAPAASGSPARGPPVRRPPSPGGRRSRARRRPGRRSARRGPVVHAPSTVTAITISSARVRSPPTTLAPTSAHSSAKPRAKSSAHCTGRSAGAARPTVSDGGPTAHRVDVGEVLRRGPVADVGGRGPVAPEVPPLDHQVGRHHDVPGLDPQHGGVVARARSARAPPAGRGRPGPRSVRTRRRRRGWRRAGTAGGPAWAHPTRCRRQMRPATTSR